MDGFIRTTAPVLSGPEKVAILLAEIGPFFNSNYDQLYGALHLSDEEIRKIRKAMKLRHVKYDDNGRRVSEEEEIVMVEEEQYVPADVGAIRFYLTNRAPERWQNKVEMETEIHADGFEDYLVKRELEGTGSGY